MNFLIRTSSIDVFTLQSWNNVGIDSSSQPEQILDADNHTEEVLTYQDASLLALGRISFHLVYLYLWFARLTLWTVAYCWMFLKTRKPVVCAWILSCLREMRRAWISRDVPLSRWSVRVVNIAMGPVRLYHKLKRILIFLDRISQMDVQLLRLQPQVIEHSGNVDAAESARIVTQPSSLHGSEFDETFGAFEHSQQPIEAIDQRQILQSSSLGDALHQPSSRRPATTRHNVGRAMASQGPATVREPSSEPSRCAACGDVGAPNTTRPKIPRPKLVPHRNSQLQLATSKKSDAAARQRLNQSWQ